MILKTFIYNIIFIVIIHRNVDYENVIEIICVIIDDLALSSISSLIRLSCFRVICCSFEVFGSLFRSCLRDLITMLSFFELLLLFFHIYDVNLVFLFIRILVVRSTSALKMIVIQYICSDDRSCGYSLLIYISVSLYISSQ